MDIDKNFIKDQQAYLEDLICFKDYPLHLQNRDKIGWADWEYEPLAIVTQQAALSVLRRVHSDKLTLKDYYDWAVSIAGRDTIDYEKGYASVLKDIIYDIITIYESREVVPTPEDFVSYQLNKLENAHFDDNEVDD